MVKKWQNRPTWGKKWKYLNTCIVNNNPFKKYLSLNHSFIQEIPEVKEVFMKSNTDSFIEFYFLLCSNEYIFLKDLSNEHFVSYVIYK